MLGIYHQHVDFRTSAKDLYVLKHLGIDHVGGTLLKLYRW